MDLIQELSCDGVAPSGPVSAWPKERNEVLWSSQEGTQLEKEMVLKAQEDPTLSRNNLVLGPDGKLTPKKYVNGQGQPKKMPGLGKMARGLVKTAGQAVMHGKVSEEIREERYDTCKACPFFDAASKRCTDCGCFMEAKTWVGGDPNMLCPKKKWSR